jgi:hypothetical protein
MAPNAASAAAASASGTAHYGVSGLPLVILGPEIAAPTLDGVLRLEPGVVGQVVGVAGDPYSRPG